MSCVCLFIARRSQFDLVNWLEQQSFRLLRFSFDFAKLIRFLWISRFCIRRDCSLATVRTRKLIRWFGALFVVRLANISHRLILTRERERERERTEDSRAVLVRFPFRPLFAARQCRVQAQPIRCGHASLRSLWQPNVTVSTRRLCRSPPRCRSLSASPSPRLFLFNSIAHCSQANFASRSIQLDLIRS
jgi:hypothetical protein